MKMINENEILERYKSYLFSVVSTTTYKDYLRHLNQFERFLLNKEKTLLQSDKDDVRSFIDINKISSGLAYQRLAGLSKFYTYLITREIILANPTAYIEWPKVLPKVHEAVTTKDIEKLLSLPNTSTVAGLRDKAIMELFYCTGIRAAELTGLRIYDIDFTNGHILVQGKGNKERLIPIRYKLQYWLEKYIARRHELLKGANCQFLFFGFCDRSRMRKANTGSVSKRIREYAIKAGLSYNFTSHSLRHAFATHLIEHGADIVVVQELLGHEDIKTTELYVHIETQRLKELHQKHHPRA